MLTAFGIPDRSRPVALPGGQGTSWRVGKAVLKPADTGRGIVAWQASVLHELDGRSAFRVSPPLRSVDGSWVVAGWTACRFEPGAPEPGRWRDVVEVGKRLHEAVAHLPEPAFLRARTDRWAVADRIAWAELPLPPDVDADLVGALLGACRPVRARSQLVHGDLSRNVLFAGGLPPLVIDLSAYWRPTALATAVVVADALVWHGATATGPSPSVLRPLLEVADLPQYLLRALVFRIVADCLAPGADRGRGAGAYRPVVRCAVDLASGA